MSEQVEIIAVETSEKVRFTGPFMSIRLNGYSYVNKKVASLLQLNHGDTVRFYHNADKTVWYIANDPIAGATIKKIAGLYKFCDLSQARKILRALHVPGTRASFPIGSQIETLQTSEGPRKVLFINPNFFNAE